MSALVSSRSAPEQPVVLLNAIKLHQGAHRAPTGNFQHTLYLAQALCRRTDVTVKVLTDQDSHGAMRAHISEGKLWHTDFRGESVIAADRVVVKAIRELKPDIYHRPTGQLPFQLPRVKAVATIADLNFTVLPTSRMKWLYKQISYRWTVSRANWITCVSHFTRNEVLRRLRADPNKTSVIYHGSNSLPDPDESLAEEMGRPFWLTFGHERHKNVEICLRSLSAIHSGVGLVVVGATEYISDTLKPLVHHLGLQERVLFPGKISGKKLHGLYSRALGLLFLSRYEGFGLPVLEAMGVGCPVVASNVCSLPEVVGDAGVLLDPDDLPSIQSAMKRLEEDQSFRQTLIEKGRDQAQRFSWERAAEETAAVYLNLHKLRR